MKRRRSKAKVVEPQVHEEKPEDEAPVVSDDSDEEQENAMDVTSEPEIDDEEQESATNDAESDDEEQGNVTNAAERGESKQLAEGDEVDFATLTGIGEADDSDVEEALRVVPLSALPPQTLSLAINDEAALDDALKAVALFDTAGRHCAQKLPFRESLSVKMASDGPLPANLAADDLARERRFAELTTGAVHEGLAQLRALGVKFRRPDDYFAQMIKSDAQMTRVKAHMVAQRDAISSAEGRRKARTARSSKEERQAQRLATQQRNKATKDEIAATTKLRKDRVRRREEAGAAGAASDDEFPIELLEGTVEQLDADSRFTSVKDISSGKKRAWKDRRADDSDVKRSAGEKSPAGPSGIKKKGPKKRLGKSRRKASAARTPRS